MRGPGVTLIGGQSEEIAHGDANQLYIKCLPNEPQPKGINGRSDVVVVLCEELRIIHWRYLVGKPQGIRHAPDDNLPPCTQVYMGVCIR